MKGSRLAIVLTNLLGGILVKFLPVLCSYLVLFLFTNELFGEFVYFLTFSAFITTAVSSGLISAMLSEITKQEQNEIVIVKRHLIILFGLLVFITGLTHFVNLIFCFVGFDIYVAAVISGLAISLVMFSISLLQFKMDEGFVAKMLVVNVIVFIFLFLFLSWFIGFSVFTSYSVTYLISSLIILFLSTQRLHESKGESKDRLFDFERCKWTLSNIAQVYIPNLSWMFVILLIHTTLKDSDSYSSFAMGYQLISILTFAPIALTPIMIKQYGYSSLTKAKAKALRMSLMTLLICFFLTWPISFSISKIVNITNEQVFLLTSFSAMFIAGLAPISNYLIIAKKHYKMLVGSTILLLTFETLYIMSPTLGYFGFFVGYLVSYLVVMACVYRYD